MICPACGHDKVIYKQTKQLIKEKYSDGEYIDNIIYICEKCGSQWDMLADNDVIVRAAVQRQLQIAYKNIIDSMESLPGIERILGLDQEQLTEWYEKGAPVVAVKLMQILKSYNFILNDMEFWNI